MIASGVFELSKTKESGLAYYFPIVVKRTDGFMPFPVVLAQSEIQTGVSTWCNGLTDGLWNRCKQVCTPVALLRSLLGKYPRERYEPLYLPS